MKGYIKIEATTYEGKEGLSVDTKLRDVDYIDRIAVINGVCDALSISPAELKFMAGLIDSDFMEAMVDTINLKGDDDEPQEAKKKKPNVHIVGGDAEDMLELLKDLLD